LQATREQLEVNSQKTKQQLAQLCLSVSDVQVQLASALGSANFGAGMAASHGVQQNQQHALFSDHYIPVLARDEVLDTVFSFIGIGEYFYTGAVCRNWRGRYIQFCSSREKSVTSEAVYRISEKGRCELVSRRFDTCLCGIVTTAARLQHAFDNGLTITMLAQDQMELAYAVAGHSIEPTVVLTLARVYGLQWSDYLATAAAQHERYALLKWLHKCGCVSSFEAVIENALDGNNLAHMKQIRAITGPWDDQQLSLHLWYAGVDDELDVVKWLHEQGAGWPTGFCYLKDVSNSHCWSLRCVQWALANGSTWLTWRCQDLALQHYHCNSGGTENNAEHSDDTCSPNCDRKYAAELFKWAHENGCPCTCNDGATAAIAAAAV
jgi:hypothetical protein